MVLIVVLEALDHPFFEGAVQALNIAIYTEMDQFSQAMVQTVFATGPVKTTPAGYELMGLQRELSPWSARMVCAR